MSVQVDAWSLEKSQGGRGVLLGGVPGVSAANVVILGGGVSGFNAAQMAVGAHADVELFDVNLARLEELDALFKNQVQTVFSNPTAVYEAVCRADLVIGAVLVPGGKAPKLVTREMLGDMKKGAVLVDIAIDQGGCFETSRATSHDDPIYEVDGIVHYCVANMPGAVPRTSTFALNNVTLPHTLNIANNGPIEAMRRDPHLLNGLNVAAGKITYKAVADDLDLDYAPAESFL
jgi:alanine dehydrogenase